MQYKHTKYAAPTTQQSNPVELKPQTTNNKTKPNTTQINQQPMLNQ